MTPSPQVTERCSCTMFGTDTGTARRWKHAPESRPSTTTVRTCSNPRSR
ncbi:hypothetical protein [Nonomuraea sp. NPDC049309]